LLLRLELDGLKVAKQIVSLLSNSFFPQKKGAEAQVERCLVFLNDNPESARRFYFFLPKFCPGDQGVCPCAPLFSFSSANQHLCLFSLGLYVETL